MLYPIRPEAVGSRGSSREVSDVPSRRARVSQPWRSRVSALSPGCVLLYKQDFTKKLGLCCITCTYCSQTCQRGVTEQLDGSTWDFCSEDCKSKYLLWYCKVRGQTGGKGQQGARADVLRSGVGPSPGRGSSGPSLQAGAAGLIPGQRAQRTLGGQL